MLELLRGHEVKRADGQTDGLTYGRTDRRTVRYWAGGWHKNACLYKLLLLGVQVHIRLLSLAVYRSTY